MKHEIADGEDTWRVRRAGTRPKGLMECPYGTTLSCGGGGKVYLGRAEEV
jgi:hypothetical protein